MKTQIVRIIFQCVIGWVICQQLFAEAPQDSPVEEGYRQMVMGLTLASSASNALHNYYMYYHECPSNIKALNLPDVNIFADSPLESLTLDKACSLQINYKSDQVLVEGLRGRTIILRHSANKDTDFMVTSCSFNGDRRFAPQADCQLTAEQQLALSAEVVEMGERFSQLYNERGAIPTLTGPMNEAVLAIFERKKVLSDFYTHYGKCPAEDEQLAITERPTAAGYFVESVMIEGCDLVARLKNQENLFPELRGKTLILRLLPTTQKGVYLWQCGSDAERKFLPRQCQLQ